MAGIEQSLQALALDEFHADVVEAVFFSGVVDNHDVGMRKQPGSARFGLETGKKLRAAEAGAFFAEADGFDGHGAADDRVGGAVDHAHGTAAEFAEDLVTARSHHCRHTGTAARRRTIPSDITPTKLPCAERPRAKSIATKDIGNTPNIYIQPARHGARGASGRTHPRQLK